MTLTAGSRLGPYEILSPLGAGGMGEVYRAKDSRLGREVAIKVLSASFSADPDRLRRFEQEARAAGILNHPNITAVHDIGSHEGAPYVVSELLEGETLRSRLASGALPVRKALDYAIQITRGLGAAHEKGIVHRDLKPENLFVTLDGRVKILDFGLAKLKQGDEGGEKTNLPTATAGTEPGVVMGTMGYMSPEQVRGRPADRRSDLFSFGAIFYEMLSGQRAFRGDTAADTITAILSKEPPDLTQTNRDIHPGIERIVRHCLEKNPEERFDSARDLAFDLEALSGVSLPAAAVVVAPTAASWRPRRWLASAIAVVALLAIAAAYQLGRRKGTESRPSGVSFSQLTFRPQPIFNARFAADGKTVVFSAAPSGNTPEIFSLRPDVPGPTPRGLNGVHLLSISSRGELAVLTHPRYINHDLFLGTLARMPLEGGAPREIVAGVREADWTPDGTDLAIIRDVNGKDRLEFPAGRVLYEAGGYLSNPRFSRKGDRIAFFEHPIKFDDRGLVAVVDLAGKKTILSAGYWALEGLAWSADGNEVLFCAGSDYSDFTIYAVTLAGQRRTALQSPGGLTIQDIAADGRWIASRDEIVRDTSALAPGQDHERDLSWLDLTRVRTLSPDGKTMLFTEENSSAGPNYSTCLRQTDGSPVVRLGDGTAQDLSRDGQWVLAVVPTDPQQLVVYPTGAGQPRRLESGGIVGYISAKFFPDARRVLACGHEAGRAMRCYVQEVAGGTPHPVTPEGTSNGFVSPDGRQVVVSAGEKALQLYSAEGGDPHPVAGSKPDEYVVRWSADGHSLLVHRRYDVPTRVERLDLSTGRREPFRTLRPAELTGVLDITTIAVSDDEKSYAYTSRRMSSHLYLMGGPR